MKALSSYSVGDSFEARVFERISQIVREGKFYVSSKNSRIFRKKGLFSKDRNGEIIFDIVIETYIENSESPSIITVIECKNYSHPVPVDDVEEFDSKLNQLTQHNVKGYIFASTSFQKGGMNIAKSKGIGLARMNGSDDIQWILHRKDRSSDSSIVEADRSSRLSTGQAPNFLCCDGAKCFDSLPSLLISIGVIDTYTTPIRHIRVPFISLDQIEETIQSLPLDRLYSNGRLETDKLLRWLRESYGAEFIPYEDLGYASGKRVLGRINFDPVRITLSKVLTENEAWRRFTLAHEVGHLVLHFDYMADLVDEASDLENAVEGDLSDDVNKKMETQANMFASQLLLRPEQLEREVALYFRNENIRKGYIYYDHQRVNQQLLYGLLVSFKRKYWISNEAAKIRLKRAGYIRSPYDQ